MAATYLLVLATCAAVTLPLEVVLGARVYRRPGRWLGSLLAVLVPFVAWDVWATGRGHWSFDPRQTVGVVLPGGLPIEELLFFGVVPTCALLTFEAIRTVTGWPAGDEEGAE